MENSFNDAGKCESTGKCCYTEKEADTLLNKKHHRKGCGSKQVPKRKYFCHECGCWHTTHFASCKRARNHQMLIDVLENEERNSWRKNSVEFRSYRLNRW